MCKLSTGTTIRNRFTLKTWIGSGGFADAHIAHDHTLGAEVVVKTISVSSSKELERVRKEVRSAARPNSPNVVKVIDAGVQRLGSINFAYIAMERVQGPTLRQLVEEGPIPLATALRLMRGVVSGVNAIHKAGVIHRDLKPENVLVDDSGVVKIIDFGIAHVGDEEHMTREGEIMGTPNYISPEQAAGERAGPQADIYASGVILFELITGERPFQCSGIALLKSHMNVMPPTPSSIRASIPEALDELVLAMLAKAPSDRPTAPEVLEKLKNIAKRRKRARRPRWQFAFVMAVLSVVLSLLAITVAIVCIRPTWVSTLSQLPR